MELSRRAKLYSEQMKLPLQSENNMSEIQVSVIMRKILKLTVQKGT